MDMKQERKRLGLTQAETAKAIGISRQYYNEIEKNPDSRKLSADIVRRIAETFGVSMDEVVA